jgi:hypothetical protein
MGKQWWGYVYIWLMAEFKQHYDHGGNLQLHKRRSVAVLLYKFYGATTQLLQFVVYGSQKPHLSPI